MTRLGIVSCHLILIGVGIATWMVFIASIVDGTGLDAMLPPMAKSLLGGFAIFFTLIYALAATIDHEAGEY